MDGDCICPPGFMGMRCETGLCCNILTCDVVQVCVRERRQKRVRERRLVCPTSVVILKMSGETKSHMLNAEFNAEDNKNQTKIYSLSSSSVTWKSWVDPFNHKCRPYCGIRGKMQDFFSQQQKYLHRTSRTIFQFGPKWEWHSNPPQVSNRKQWHIFCDFPELE